MKLSPKHSLLSFFILAGFSTNALAQLTARCNEDPIASATDAAGRNAWARKCGYIKRGFEAALNEEGEYVVFTTGRAPEVPVSELADCVDGLTRLGTCPAGCYTASQKVLFPHGYETLPHAYESGLTEVMSLTKDSRVDRLNLAPQKIETYVAGETLFDAIQISTEDGKNLQVTAQHPLVLTDGTMVTAKALKIGQNLLTAEGLGTAITEVKNIAYRGLVWNVQPETKDRTENIVVAEGLLTGSIRYQNEWANDLHRLSVRDDIQLD